MPALRQTLGHFTDLVRSRLDRTLVAKNRREPIHVGRLDHDLTLPEVCRSFRRFSSDIELQETPTGLRVASAGPHLALFSPPMHVDLATHRLVRVVAEAPGLGGAGFHVHFSTDRHPEYLESKRSVEILPHADGPVTLCFDFSDQESWAGDWVTLRLTLERPPLRHGDFELRRLTLLPWPVSRLDLAPPLIPPIQGEVFDLPFEIRAEHVSITRVRTSPGLATLEVAHRDRLAAAGRPGALRLRATEPGVQEVSLEEGRGTGRSTTEILIRAPRTSPPHRGEPTAAEGLIEMRAPGGDRTALRLVPLVAITRCREHEMRRTVVPLSPRQGPSGDGRWTGSRRIGAGRLTACLTLGAARGDRVPWRVEIDGPALDGIADVELPVFVLGDPRLRSHKDLALLPGVEMLASADLPSRAGWFPDASKVTWPCALLEQRGLVCAVSWPEPPLTPLFLAPDLRSGTSAHVLALHLPPRSQGRTFGDPLTTSPFPLHVEGDLWISRRPRREVLIDLGARLCPTPSTARVDTIAARSVEALASTFRGVQGLTRPYLGAAAEEEYFDPRSCLSLLAASRSALSPLERAATAELERFARTDGGDELTLDLGILFPRHLPAAVAHLARRASELQSTQRDDGTWPPRQPLGGHAADPEALATTAAAIAGPLRTLIEAYLLGLADAAPIRRGLARLRDPGLLPTGGQPWEFAPEVPELLGAGEAARAWTLAAVAGLEPRGLELALDWLTLGLTFLRCRPHGDALSSFGCIPALGRTRDGTGNLLWYRYSPGDQLDWRGVSCPWVGLRFAHALEAWLEAAGDRHREAGQAGSPAVDLLSRLSHEILRHAAALQGDDGSLPDGFHLRERIPTEPLYRAPLDLAWLALSRLNASPRTSFARRRSLTAAGCGRFRPTGEGLLFEPRLPGLQALAVVGACTAESGGRKLPVEALASGIGRLRFHGPRPLHLHEIRRDA